jgi:hypothetical protein
MNYIQYGPIPAVTGGFHREKNFVRAKQLNKNTKYKHKYYQNFT